MRWWYNSKQEAYQAGYKQAVEDMRKILSSEDFINTLAEQIKEIIKENSRS